MSALSSLGKVGTCAFLLCDALKTESQRVVCAHFLCWSDKQLQATY